MTVTEPPRPAGSDGTSDAALRLQILHVPGCPLLEQLRATVQRALAGVGLRADVEAIEGPYPSPTLLVDGIDVTGRPPEGGPACRLDLPTEEQVIAALLERSMAAVRRF